MPSDSKARSASAPQPFDHLTPPDLLRAASEQGLALTCERAEFDRSGLDFLVLHAHDTAGSPWIVRTPRRASVLEAARVEARVLALVAEYLPVAVPEWRVFSDEVIAYPRLAGVPAVTADPGADLRGTSSIRQRPAARSSILLRPRCTRFRASRPRRWQAQAYRSKASPRRAPSSSSCCSRPGRRCSRARQFGRAGKPGYETTRCGRIPSRSCMAICTPGIFCSMMPGNSRVSWIGRKLSKLTPRSTWRCSLAASGRRRSSVSSAVSSAVAPGLGRA